MINFIFKCLYCEIVKNLLKFNFQNTGFKCSYLKTILVLYFCQFAKNRKMCYSYFMHKKYIITSEESGNRIDSFLSKKDASFSRGDVVRALKDENILCNDKKIKPSYKLEIDDIIVVKELKKQITGLVPNANVILNIVDENENFLVINKERGIQVHPSTTEREFTITNGLIAKYPEIKKIGDDELRPGIVHRLDKYTSGLMVIAKNQKTFEKLKEKFATRKIDKTYITLAWGQPRELIGEINAPIARAMGYTRQKVVLNDSGKYNGEVKNAVTSYKTIDSFDSGISIKKTSATMGKEIISPSISMIEAKPKTGRMHQIRVHMRHIGTPIIGDVKYETKGFKELNQKLFKTLSSEVLHTFYLHSQKLSFEFDGKKFEYETELPKYFDDILKRK